MTTAEASQGETGTPGERQQGAVTTPPTYTSQDVPEAFPAREVADHLAYIRETFRLLIQSRKYRGPVASRIVTADWRAKWLEDELAKLSRLQSNGKEG